MKRTNTNSSIASSISQLGSINFSDDAFSNNPEDYDVRLPIGYGSSAVVYNAYYKPLNRRVAIKVIDLDMFERNQIDELRRETQVMALCKHPNVLRVNGAFVTDSKLYIVTPYLSAGSCLDIMKIAYPDGFDEVSIATILKQALQGLDYLHKNGHIHRDVKAGNLLMDDDGSVLLADFGVSSSLMENGDRRGMRKTFVGTPCWMAPEVMEQAGYDYKADIWSFGITAIELATGHAPFAKYPPIKVLMLTLSNDPPTLDRESTKHRYSKLLKDMIDTCLQKDPARRPSAEKLLGHAFFKQAKKRPYLVSGILHNLPLLEQRPPKKAAQKMVIPEKGVSWDFDAEEEPVRRPRTVTFETPARPLSVNTTPPAQTQFVEPAPVSSVAATPTSENGSVQYLQEEVATPQSGTPPPVSNQTSDKPVKKSRFVIEEANVGVSSPVIPSATEQIPAPAPVPVEAGSPASSQGTSTAQLEQNFQGLGVSSPGIDQSALPEVKKGRFSVKDTTAGTSSPIPSSIKTMPNSESLLSPSRSLSSSPVEGVEGVRIGGTVEQPPHSERKSRFEVHHNHSVPTSGSNTTNGTGSNSPALTGSQGSPLSRESSLSRVAGESTLSRDNSSTRVSRFSIESTASPTEGSVATSSVPPSSVGTPNPSNGPSSTQSKRSRFQISSVEGGRTADYPPGDAAGSVHTTPNTSPTGSLLRGQPGLMEALGSHAVYSHLETLYRQNEQQRQILAELSNGFGMKSSPMSNNKIHGEGGGGGSPLFGLPATSSVGGGNSLSSSNSSNIGVTSGTSGSAPGSMERQLHVAVRENESLRRENEALKRELDRLRRGAPGLKFISKDREDRMGAIGRYIADSARGYDIVGLQEVWVYDDYLRIKELVRDTLPYSKHWHSGVLGSGLVILSKFPIVHTMMRRFALNGDPYKFSHGDWYVGKCCVSATVVHPTCGEIEVFNTHLHAGYDPVGTPDSYLGCRIGEAWEMASLVKAATTQGRHVLSLGDYNSAPNSLVIQLLTKQGGVTDSWKRLHPEPNPVPSGLTPEEGVTIMGVTCDTPLNTWSNHSWLNYLTNDPIGERLDYIFYRETPELVCTSVEVAVREQISGIGTKGSPVKNYSDHFGVHATFAIQPAVYHFQNRKPLTDASLLSSPITTSSSTAGNSITTQVANGSDHPLKEQQDEGLSIDTLEQIVMILKQHMASSLRVPNLDLKFIFPSMLISSLVLLIAFFWIQPRWAAFIVAFFLAALSAGWIVHFLYGFLFGGELSSAFLNVIQEVETVLEYKIATTQHEQYLGGVGSRSSTNGGRVGLLQK
ncbi:hypothetical protein BGZ83_009150 [Gryganskiella cystojenkinii]|nr:hypothetical protein BGZ83_009150 [Gryganskiella cystojenkinii]